MRTIKSYVLARSPGFENAREESSIRVVIIVYCHYVTAERDSDVRTRFVTCAEGKLHARRFFTSFSRAHYGFYVGRNLLPLAWFLRTLFILQLLRAYVLPRRGKYLANEDNNNAMLRCGAYYGDYRCLISVFEVFSLRRALLLRDRAGNNHREEKERVKKSRRISGKIINRPGAMNRG